MAAESAGAAIVGSGPPADGSRGMTENMSGLSQAASETKQSANQVGLASSNIVGHTEALSKAVDTFLNDVAAA